MERELNHTIALASIQEAEKKRQKKRQAILKKIKEK
jgi:hypothetical protein